MGCDPAQAIPSSVAVRFVRVGPPGSQVFLPASAWVAKIGRSRSPSLRLQSRSGAANREPATARSAAAPRTSTKLKTASHEAKNPSSSSNSVQIAYRSKGTGRPRPPQPGCLA